jgi:hypothetical protein
MSKRPRRNHSPAFKAKASAAVKGEKTLAMLAQQYHARDVSDGDGAPEIISERGQAELGAHVLQPAHQKCALVHPLLDRAKRMLDRLPADGKNAGPGCEPRRHALEHRLVLPTVDAQPAAPRCSVP